MTLPASSPTSPLSPLTTRRVLLVEDDPIHAQLLERAVQLLDPPWTVTLCATGSEALDWIERPDTTFNLAVVDLGLPDLGGLEIVRAWRARYSQSPVLVVSAISAERTVLEAIRVGANGYLLKDGDTGSMARGISQVLEGNAPISPALARYLFKLAGAPQAAPQDSTLHLTKKERETLRHIGRGHSYMEAAELMGVSLSTVQTHVRKLYRKLGAHSQIQAVIKARENGLI